MERAAVLAWLEEERQRAESSGEVYPDLWVDTIIERFKSKFPEEAR